MANYNAQGSHTVRRRPKDGESPYVVDTIVRYAMTSSEYDRPSMDSGLWDTEMPTLIKGWYLHTWTRTIYSDGKFSDVFGVTYIAMDGTEPYELFLNKPSIPCYVDADTKKVLSKVELYINVTLRRNGANVQMTKDTFSIVAVASNSSHGATIGNEIIDPLGAPGKAVFKITVPSGLEEGKRLDSVVVTITERTSGRTVSGVVQMVYIPRGLTGDMGKLGPMPVPWGTYSDEVEYFRSKDDDGAYIDTPVVWQIDGGAKGEGAYYALLGSVSQGMKPSENLSSGIWKEYTMMDYVFAKAMMAPFGQFGKAVMWNDYFFSQRGLNASGVEQDYTRTMFNEHGRLNGNVVPNLFLDLRTGAASMRKFSELFEDFVLNIPGHELYNSDDIFNYIHRIDMNRSHNVSVYPRTIKDYMGRQVEVCGAVVLPRYGTEEGQWSEDGTHATVVYQFEQYRKTTLTSYRPTNHPFVAVCADARMFDKSEYVNNRFPDEKMQDGVNCFIWKGWPVKWILLPHGTSLKIRSVKQYEEIVEGGVSAVVKKRVTGVNWIVENAADFEAINLEVTMQRTTNSQTTDMGVYAFEKPTLTGGVTMNAIGSGIINGESVFDTTSIFVDLGEGVHADIGAGSKREVVNHVRVGLTERLVR